jgi:negative regulator of replication initiation
MATEKKAVSIYLRQDLYELIASHAIADGRTISNYLERHLDRTVPTTVQAVPAHAQVRDAVASGQVDLETAIAHAVKRGPVTPLRSRRRV